MSALPSYVWILRAGYGQARESGVQRTSMEAGPPKVLKVKSRVLVTRQLTLRVASATDLDAFMTWFASTINEGADWFDWTDPVDSATKSARFVSLGQAAPESSAREGWRIPASIETWSA